MSDRSSPSFLGYRRAAGRPGIRNYLIVLNLTGLTAPSARHVSAQLTGSKLVSMPHGRAIDARAEVPVDAALAGFATHPNAGAVLVLSADRRKADRLRDRVAGLGRPMEIVTLDAAGRDALTFRTMALRAGARLMVEMSRQRSEPFGWEHLALALECGMSDPSSGLVANPLLGRVADRLIADGGAVLFGETTEWLGSEEALAARGATQDVRTQILAAVTRREDLARASGLDLLGNNPNEANIASGLTTIEDKAIGSVAKSGTSPVTAALGYAEPFASPGLAAMDGPSYTPESLSGLVASGAQMVLFTSGVGNSYVSRIAPTLKITANAETAARLPEQFDFDCSDVVQRPSGMADSQDRLVARMMEVASGALTFGEILGEDDEVISRFGETV